MQRSTNYNFYLPENSDYRDIAALNYNFETIDTELAKKAITYDFGSHTLADLESAMATFGSNLENFQQRNITFSVSSASGVFKQSLYIGYMYRISSGRYVCMLLQSVYTIASMPTGSVVYGQYRDGTWDWKDIQRGSCDMLGVSDAPTSSSDTKTLSLSSTIDNYKYILVGNFYNSTGNICYGSAKLPLSIFRAASGFSSANRLGLYNGSCLKFWVLSGTSINMTLLDSTTLPGGYIIVYGIT